MIRSWTPGQWVLRAVIVLGLLGALFATVPAGATPAPWLVLVVLVGSVIFAAYPDSAAGSFAMVVVLAWWGIGLRDGLHPAAVLAAGGLITAHVAGTIAAFGPGSLPLDRRVLGRWTGRGLVVLLAAPLALGVALVVRDQPAPAGVWLSGLVAVLVALVSANLLFARRPG